MDRDDVDRWLRDYVEAWKRDDRDRIAALFAQDVSYRYHRSDEPLRGREVAVESWLGEGADPGASAHDEPGTFDATYRAVAIDGETAVATGSTRGRAAPGAPVSRVFDNCFATRFDADDRCCEFTERYVERPR